MDVATKDIHSTSNYYLNKVTEQTAKSNPDVWFIGDVNTDGHI